ncbi:methylated-DNA--[protein]-cysteine S-methyltransferase [Desulfovibrio litoralis]|uniref:Methylated-DNA--protein-cysteine methyltransferase n=1 Tax=Desulfovibrio litoralis DSM 11393 TaxID=1121455 RepID=A0A1M7TQG8_9BACT|nr:methylated-DNA--[protein]-cysteine S-methyltransferase [Desulfovibrio litoralis]SHN72916.1 methylated-DNA-[protein]-cysteine S-methyltransferase [Desulfovibrio litoralis DSM 11393]
MLLFQHTQIGKIGIVAENGVIIKLLLPNSLDAESILNTDLKETTELQANDKFLLAEAFSQLNAYLDKKLKVFSLPLKAVGTPFMQLCWSELVKIPYGTTMSYKMLATAMQNPKAVRAVGLANNKNPIPIFIPCHRVIGHNGKLVGYRGGLELKAFLLELESTF